MANNSLFTLDSQNGTTDILQGFDFNKWTIDRGVETFINFVLSIFTVIGNGIIIAAMLLFDKFDRLTPSLVVNLAVADLIVGITSLLTTIILSIDRLLIALDRAMCLVINFCMVFSLSASFACLPVLSLDCYIAILHPFHYSSLQRGGWCLLVGPWFYASAVAGLSCLFERYSPQTFCIYHLMYDERYIHAMASLFCVNAILLIAMNVRIFHAAWLHHRKIQVIWPQQQPTEQEQRNQKTFLRSLKAAKVFASIVGIYLICYTYGNVLTILTWAGLQGDPQTMTAVGRISPSLMYANSAANIFVYAASQGSFRRNIRKLLCRGPAEVAGNSTHNN